MSDQVMALAVARVWREVLGMHQAGPHDGFFDLGGDSLVATKLVTRLRKELGIQVSLLTIFENPTIAELVDELQALDELESDAHA
jgi:acyl carrier protein